jgi:hypothetical protein
MLMSCEHFDIIVMYILYCLLFIPTKALTSVLNYFISTLTYFSAAAPSSGHLNFVLAKITNYYKYNSVKAVAHCMIKSKMLIKCRSGLVAVYTNWKSGLVYIQDTFTQK